MALTTGGKVEKTDYDTIKSNATTSISTVGTTWTWSNTVSVGSLVTYAQMNEVRSAINKAYDLINRGCTSHNSSVGSGCSNYANYSDGCSSNWSSDNGSNYSSDCSSNQVVTWNADWPGNNGSNTDWAGNCVPNQCSGVWDAT